MTSKTIEKFLKAMAELTDEDRAQILKYGIVLPKITTPDQLLTAKWGYRCKHCSRIAFEFLGHEKPIGGVQLSQYAWTQSKLQAIEIDRNHPRCQEYNCRQPVFLLGGAVDHRLVWDIDVYTKSRDLAFQRMQERRKRGFAMEPAQLEAPLPEAPAAQPGKFPTRPSTPEEIQAFTMADANFGPRGS